MFILTNLEIFEIILKDIVMNQCIRLIDSLRLFSELRPIAEVKQATVGIVSILGNVKSVNEFFS